MNKFPLKNLLWIDAVAALVSGCIVFIFGYQLSHFFDLPENLLRALSTISLGYASFSFYLASQKLNSKRLLQVLVIANSLYATACMILVWIFYSTTLLGSGYLLLESLFVAGLAHLEWRQIKLHLTTPA